MEDKKQPIKQADLQRIIIELTLGREPKNEEERILKQEIDEIKNKGYIIDLPFE